MPHLLTLPPSLRRAQPLLSTLLTALLATAAALTLLRLAD